MDCVLDIFDCNQNGFDDATNDDGVEVEQATIKCDFRATMPRKRIGANFFKTLIEEQQQQKNVLITVLFFVLIRKKCVILLLIR